MLFALLLIVMIRESVKHMTSMRVEKPEGGGGRGSSSSAYGDVPIAMKRASSSSPNERAEPNPKRFSEEHQEDEKVSPGDWLLQ